MRNGRGILIACAAYVGEHSFPGSERQIIRGCPDANDLNHPELIGRK